MLLLRIFSPVDVSVMKPCGWHIKKILFKRMTGAIIIVYVVYDVDHAPINPFLTVLKPHELCYWLPENCKYEKSYHKVCSCVFLSWSAAGTWKTLEKGFVNERNVQTWKHSGSLNSMKSWVLTRVLWYQRWTDADVWVFWSSHCHSDYMCWNTHENPLLQSFWIVLTVRTWEHLALNTSENTSGPKKRQKRIQNFFF